MKPISPFGLPVGLSVAFWSIIGILRFVYEKILGFSPYKHRGRPRYSAKDIAVILPAHNEELVIRSSIRAIKDILDPGQIYVVSDGSTDRTFRRARMEGVHVSHLSQGRGKARAMVYLLHRHRLFERYKLIFILDADTRPDKTLIKKALPLFNDPEVGVVFAAAKIPWRQHWLPNWKYYFISYRERLNLMLRYMLMYGQTWKFTSLNYIIPGFCTIYRSDVLSKLEIDTPGILIEDFNLSFQFHKKKMAKIAFNPSIIGWDQYPDNLNDYVNQIRRWNIGFFQTVKKNGVWPSFFWLTLGLFSFEVILNSLFVVFLPLLLLYLLFLIAPGTNPIESAFTSLYASYGPFHFISLEDLLLFTFLTDYLVTVLVGLFSRKPQLIFYGLFFFPMHFVVSFVLLRSIIPGFFSKSSGKWVSPTRSIEQLESKTKTNHSKQTKKRDSQFSFG